MCVSFDNQHYFLSTTCHMWHAAATLMSHEARVMRHDTCGRNTRQSELPDSEALNAKGRSMLQTEPIVQVCILLQVERLSVSKGRTAQFCHKLSLRCHKERAGTPASTQVQHRGPWCGVDVGVSGCPTHVMLTMPRPRAHSPRALPSLLTTPGHVVLHSLSPCCCRTRR